MMFQPVKA